MKEAKQIELTRHVARLLRCRRCPRMQSAPVSGGAVVSDVMIIGQAPGPREPTLKRPFAHTAGKTLFRWFEQFCGMDEAAVRSKIYFAAVCRCFPGKNSGGTDRVPAPDEIRNCALWMDDEIRILQPRLIIPVGRLAIVQFIDCAKLEGVIGRKFRVVHAGHRFDLIPLPHPSGASPWHKIPPGKALAEQALKLIARHPAIQGLAVRARRHDNEALAVPLRPVVSFVRECVMEIPTRADVPETDKWDLTDLFADVSKWQEDFAWLQREYPKLEQWKGRVGESAQTLAGLLEFEKALEQKMERVYHYASLQAAEDSTNNEYLARIGQVQNLLTRISEAAAFVVPEILAIDDERFGKFLADPALKDWRIKLHKIRRMRSHVAFSARGTSARAKQRRAERLRRHIFPTDRRGHEVRRACRRNRTRATAQPKLVQLVSGEARP